MSESIDVDVVMYHHAKAVEFARTYFGCQNVVSESDARKLESERDALQARVKRLKDVGDQMAVWLNCERNLGNDTYMAYLWKQVKESKP